MNNRCLFNPFHVFPLLALFLAASAMNVSAQQRTDTLVELFYHHPAQVMVTAHRGGHSLVPENSLAGITAAVKERADILELDARLSKDSQLVVMHDETINRTSTGKGLVKAHTFQELQAYRLTFEGKPTDQRILSLKEALQAAKGQIMVDIDFKVDDVQAAKDCYALVHELGMENQVLFFVYDPKLAPKLLDYDPKIHVMPRAHNVLESRKLLTDKRIRVIHIDPGFYASAAQEISNAGVRIWANALGKYDEAAERSGGDFGTFFKDFPLVNVIQTNHPGMLKQYLLK